MVSLAHRRGPADPAATTHWPATDARDHPEGGCHPSRGRRAPRGAGRVEACRTSDGNWRIVPTQKGATVLCRKLGFDPGLSARQVVRYANLVSERYRYGGGLQAHVASVCDRRLASPDPYLRYPFSVRAGLRSSCPRGDPLRPNATRYRLASIAPTKNSAPPSPAAAS